MVGLEHETMRTSDQPIADVAGGNVPRHVALIMDGNGRWAQQRALPRSAGHWQGVEAVRRTVRAAADLGIEYLTLYSFSSENWARPASEVDYLLNLLRRFIHHDVADLHGNGVKIKVIGDREDLAGDLRALIEQSEQMTAANDKMTLVVAFNYGSRDEIARAARTLAAEVAAGRLAPEDITPDMLCARLDTCGVPDPDLIIRTSGENRISNFLLWECAYSEFLFIEKYWPEFNRQDLSDAIEEFARRERRYGATTGTR